MSSSSCYTNTDPSYVSVDAAQSAYIALHSFDGPVPVDDTLRLHHSLMREDYTQRHHIRVHPEWTRLLTRHVWTKSNQIAR